MLTRMNLSLTTPSILPKALVSLTIQWLLMGLSRYVPANPPVLPAVDQLHALFPNLQIAPPADAVSHRSTQSLDERALVSPFYQ